MPKTGARYRAFSLSKYIKLLSGRFTIWVLAEPNTIGRFHFFMSSFELREKKKRLSQTSHNPHRLRLTVAFMGRKRKVSFVSCFAVISWARFCAMISQGGIFQVSSGDKRWESTKQMINFVSYCRFPIFFPQIAQICQVGWMI